MIPATWWNYLGIRPSFNTSSPARALKSDVTSCSDAAGRIRRVVAPAHQYRKSVAGESGKYVSRYCRVFTISCS